MTATGTARGCDTALPCIVAHPAPGVVQPQEESLPRVTIDFDESWRRRACSPVQHDIESLEPRATPGNLPRVPYKEGVGRLFEPSIANPETRGKNRREYSPGLLENLFGVC